MKGLLYTILLLFSSITYSQVDFTSSVRTNTVLQNENIIFELKTNVRGEIYQPNFDGLVVVGGPSVTNSSSMVIINGVRKMSSKIIYTWYLKAAKPGNYNISPVEMKYKNKTYKTKKIQIKVISNSSNTSQNANSDYFLRVSSSKNSVYPGESFVLTLKLYTKQQPIGIDDFKVGESIGLTKKDILNNANNLDLTTDIVNGQRYFSILISKELCYIHHSNDITISPYEISTVFSKGRFRMQQYLRETKSNSIKIKVKKMPGKEPANFNGLVGQFELKHSISKTSVDMNEAIDLKISISGKGNLTTFDDPKLDLPNDFEQFDPEIISNLKTNTNGTSGNIDFNYVIVPTFYGDFEIPAYTFSYFDLATEKYKSLTTETIKIHVNKPKDFKEKAVSEKKEVDIKETDIRFIHTKNTSTYKNEDLNGGSFLHYILILSPFVILVILLLLKKRQNNLTEGDKRKLITKSAKKNIQKDLIESKKLNKLGKDEEAVKLLSTALKKYLKNKFSLTESELNSNTIQTKLNKEDNIKLFTKCWNTIEMFQYAPISTSEVDKLILETEQLINAIDSE